MQSLASSVLYQSTLTLLAHLILSQVCEGSITHFLAQYQETGFMQCLNASICILALKLAVLLVLTIFRCNIWFHYHIGSILWVWRLLYLRECVPWIFGVRSISAGSFVCFHWLMQLIFNTSTSTYSCGKCDFFWLFIMMPWTDVECEHHSRLELFQIVYCQQGTRLPTPDCRKSVGFWACKWHHPDQYHTQILERSVCHTRDISRCGQRNFPTTRMGQHIG